MTNGKWILITEVRIYLGSQCPRYFWKYKYRIFLILFLLFLLFLFLLFLLFLILINSCTCAYKLCLPVVNLWPRNMYSMLSSSYMFWLAGQHLSDINNPARQLLNIIHWFQNKMGDLVPWAFWECVGLTEFLFPT